MVTKISHCHSLVVGLHDAYTMYKQ